jgi:hypothetical protein
LADRYVIWIWENYLRITWKGAGEGDVLQVVLSLGF